MGVKFMYYIGYLHACYLAVGFKDLLVWQNVFLLQKRDIFTFKINSRTLCWIDWNNHVERFIPHIMRHLHT